MNRRSLYREAGGAVSSTKSKRSRDLVLGCLARLKVDGKVVKTEASSPKILRDYSDQFEEEE